MNHLSRYPRLLRVSLMFLLTFVLTGIVFITIAPASVLAQGGSTGTDGALVITNTVFYIDTDRYAITETISAGNTTIPYSTGLNIQAGDEILIIAMQGPTATVVGTYETATVSTVGSSTLSLNAPLANEYDGNLYKVMVQRVPNYTGVTVANGGTLTAHPWDGETGGVVFFRAVTVTVESGGSIDVSGLGYRGVSHGQYNTTGTQGESIIGPGVISINANTNGGGGGEGGQDSGGGGGGGYGTVGANGQSYQFIYLRYGGIGGIKIDNDEVLRLYFGGAGGEGGADEDGYYPGKGGNGGGILVVLSDELFVAGNVLANGQLGGNAHQISGCGLGGGGGGAGGTIMIMASSIAISGNVDAIGGTGGVYGGCGGAGGAGGAGRIRLDYNLLSGSTNPPHYSSIDPAVRKTGPAQIVPGQSVLYNITVANGGLVPATGVVVTDTLPLSITYLSHSAPVTPTINGNQVVWALTEPLTGGTSLNFALVGQVTDTIAAGQLLQNVIQVGSTTADENSTNNIFTTTATVISPYSHTLSLTPASLSARRGATETIHLRIDNTGPLADVYTVSVTGLNPAWYTPVTKSFALNPAASTTTDLKLHVNDCGASAGTTPFTITIYSQESANQVAALSGLTLLTAPQQLDLTPANNSKTGSRSQLFAWRTDAPTTGQLTVYPSLTPTQLITVTTPLSQVHVATVDNLERNTAYTWFVQSESVCGDVTTGSNRTFSVGNGIVFDPHTHNQDIAHDYGQLITMTLRNEDSLTHTLRVTVTHSYQDLIAGFIGAGSIDDGDAYITLSPGQTYDTVLAVHAQDAEQEDYHLTAKVTADEGGADEIVDYAHLSLRVLKANNFTMTLVSENPDTLVKTYQVRNLGLPITDLNIQALDPATGLPARSLIQPTLDHARLAKAGDPGDSIQFEVIPLFSPEDAIVLQAAAQTEVKTGLASPLWQTGFDVILMATVLDTTQELPGNFACQMPDELYAVTLHNVRVSYTNNDWYCTNRPSINLNFSTPGNINPDDILGATVTTGFNPAPGWHVLPHDVRLLMNGYQIGELLNQVPSGSYTFGIDPAFFNPAANPVQPVNQTLGLRTTHMNGGHYVVNTASRLDLDLANFTRYICAENPDDARNKAGQGTQPIATGLILHIANPPTNTELELSQPVTLEAEVNDEVSGATPYPVWAVITYTDHITNGSPLTETLSLPYISSNGITDTYRATWTPAYTGAVTIWSAVNAVSVNGFDTVNVTIIPKAFTVKVELLDPQGVPTDTLSLNTDGWPTPNPLTVQVTLNCPVEGGGCGDLAPFEFTINSADNARFYLYDKDLTGVTCFNEIPLPESSPTSYNGYQANCVKEGALTTFMTLFAGETITLTWNIWIQPSEVANLDITATWGNKSANKMVQIPLAQIYPIIFIPGLGATLPPRYEQSEVNFLLTNLFTGYPSFYPTLEKMGYENEKTYFVFSYDWLVSVVSSAQELKSRRIDPATTQIINENIPWIKKEAGGKIKFDFITHSTGGLVARAYLQADDWNDDVHRVVMVAPPFNGVPNGYQAWEGLEASLPIDPIMRYFATERAENAEYYTVPDSCGNGAEVCKGEVLDKDLYNFIHDPALGVTILPQFFPVRLPTEDAYLEDASKYPYPYDRQANPLLEPASVVTGSCSPLHNNTSLGLIVETFNVCDPYQDHPTFNTEYHGLNTPNKMKLVAQRIGLDNLFLVYSDIPDSTTGSYVVDHPAPINTARRWRNGKSVNSNSGNGDTLVPTISANPQGIWVDVNGNLATTPPTTFDVQAAYIGTGSSLIHDYLVAYTESQDIIATALTKLEIPFIPNFGPNEATSFKTNFEAQVSRILSILMQSPVELTLTDSQGRHLGYDPATGQDINEIPNSVYIRDADTGHKWLIVMSPEVGDATLSLTAVGTGDYTLRAHFSDEMATTKLFDITGTVTSGYTESLTLTVPLSSTEIPSPPEVDAGQDLITAQGQPTTFIGTLKDINPNDTHQISWNFGDGNLATGTLGPTHTFINEGVFTVTLTVTDSYGFALSNSLITTVLSPTNAFQEIGGEVVIEAEHSNKIIDRSGVGWITQTILSAYSGDGYISALLDIDRQFDATYATSSPELQYMLNLTTTGTYYVWLRGYGANAAGDSVILGIDDQPATIITGFSPQVWGWVNKNFVGIPATINVHVPGLHTLHLWQREDGVRVDKILLTTDNNYTPLGEGLVESEIR